MATIITLKLCSLKFAEKKIVPQLFHCKTWGKQVFDVSIRNEVFGNGILGLSKTESGCLFYRSNYRVLGFLLPIVTRKIKYHTLIDY